MKHVMIRSQESGEIDYQDLEEMIREGMFHDITAASIALCVAKVRESYTVAVCSEGLSDKQVEKLHFQKVDTPQEGLHYLEKELGTATKKLVLTHGGETLPVLHKPR